ncbi:ketopantoate reductase family protein [Glaciimonas soli]|uniref:2-dehydropantoate 2-reductase n=1 Tax=Glaciimonas soli TaxID=2590999 RepID=A0A843YYL8_9BURK|nr:2-dehydropantoate 2-reductase N-terminal domain-containing protein [Glaciimonas soli]MQR02568.1 ketopantoate reductase family protein [Glaciimonas soli]
MSEVKDILVWGAGAIGGTVGAYLSRAGLDVTFVDVVREHVEEISAGQAGLQISGPIENFSVRSPAYVPQDLKGKWKRIFLSVKAQDTAVACSLLAQHLTDDGYVVSLQNGLCEDVIARAVGTERTIGAFVNFGADWLGPGRIQYSNRAAVVVGEMDGKITERLKCLHKDLMLFEPDAILSADVSSYLWGKLGYASLLFAQAVGMSGIADCLDRPELLELFRKLAGEVMAVAKSVGIDPKGFNGFDPASFSEKATKEQAAASVKAMADFNRPNAKTHSGIWRDLAVRKRKTEVDAQLGAVVSQGRKADIACPTLSSLIFMIHEIEEGRRSLADKNLNDLAGTI